jgi:hypothetical protein
MNFKSHRHEAISRREELVAVEDRVPPSVKAKRLGLVGKAGATCGKADFGAWQRDAGKGGHANQINTDRSLGRNQHGCRTVAPFGPSDWNLDQARADPW